jgi:hypothetical protein
MFESLNMSGKLLHAPVKIKRGTRTKFFGAIFFV